MKNSRRFAAFFHLYLATLLLIGTVGLAGCASTPETSSPPPVRSQPIDARSADLLINDAVQYIAAELPQVPEIKNTQYRLVLGLGPIEVSNFKNPERFDTVMRQINSRLMRNAEMTRLFRMVQISVPTAEAVTSSIGGAPSSDFALPDSDEETGPAKYDPRDIYILTGKFTQFGDRGDLKRALYLSVSVEHPHTRQVVLTKDFRRNFNWDTEAGKWKYTP